ADVQRIQRRHFRGRENDDAVRSGIYLRIGWTTSLYVPEAALAKVRQRHGSVVGNALCIASRFVVEEEKHLVPTVEVRGTTFAKAREENRTADAAAILVACKLRPRNSTAVVEEAVRRGGCGAIKIAERTMPIIRAALRAQFDLTTAAATF